MNAVINIFFFGQYFCVLCHAKKKIRNSKEKPTEYFVLLFLVCFFGLQFRICFFISHLHSIGSIDSLERGGGINPQLHIHLELFENRITENFLQGGGHEYYAKAPPVCLSKRGEKKKKSRLTV